MVTASSNVIDVTDATFDSAVVEESGSRPVVVDFWAAWCGPCRTIGPVLERLAEEASGSFLLAKLDVDANPQTATAFAIQSIPAVKAFRGGAVANEFVGAIPEEAIRQFLSSVLPSEADGLAEEAEGAERDENPVEAGRLFRRALAVEPNHRRSALGLGRVAAMRGDLDEAKRLLEPLRPDPEAERLLAAIELSNWAEPASEASPLAAPARAAAEARYGEALAGFLQAVEEGGDHGEEARDSMLKIFSVLGDEDPLTREYRRRLSTALF